MDTFRLAEKQNRPQPAQEETERNESAAYERGDVFEDDVQGGHRCPLARKGGGGGGEADPHEKRKTCAPRFDNNTTELGKGDYGP